MATFMMNSLLPILFFMVLQLSPTTSITCNVKPPPSTTTTSVICVDQNGCCNFTTVQAAVDSNLNLENDIYIVPYSTEFSEKVKVPKEKPNITFQGQGLQSTAISWDDIASKTNGTFFTGSVEVFSDNFIAKNISFKKCQLISIAKETKGSINGAVTANGREKEDSTGFAFVNCNISGTGSIYLGRAWRPFSRVVFAFTTITNVIVPEGWNNLNDPNNEKTVFYGEYQNTGVGANMNGRVPYSRNLTATEAAPFLTKSFINGDQWLQPFA
ncbi:hypothetical protein NE237_011883 [Protea cynaroides]|uniref:pectinesterase n=1 Tax=Protea cynaroides TaxID=273540 RepID=A0A9Q0JYC2_9MAGN|nr:hypothetical protein NE237_011883 [Protea cynaroides]